MAIRIALLFTALYTYHIGFCSIQIPHYHLHISSQPMNIRISFRFICAILFALSIHFWICSCRCYRLTWMVIGRGLRVVWVSFERRLSVVWANFNALSMFVLCIHRYFQSFIDDLMSLCMWAMTPIYIVSMQVKWSEWEIAWRGLLWLSAHALKLRVGVKTFLTSKLFAT